MLLTKTFRFKELMAETRWELLQRMRLISPFKISKFRIKSKTKSKQRSKTQKLRKGSSKNYSEFDLDILFLSFIYIYNNHSLNCKNKSHIGS